MRTGWARARIARALEASLAHAGVNARFDVRVDDSLRVILEQVHAETSGDPRVVVDAPRVVLRPRLASLLRGSLEASSMDIERPQLRVAARGGGGARSPLRLPDTWPLRELTVRGAHIDLVSATLQSAFDGVDVSARFETGAIVVEDLRVRRVDGASLEAEVDDARIARPRSGGPLYATGHLRARGAADVVRRLAGLTQIEGRWDLDADARVVEDSPLPELHGTLALTDLRAGKVRIATSVSAWIDLQDGVLRAPSVSVQTIAGPLRFSQLELRPLLAGSPLSLRVEEGALRFDDLLRALGVSEHPHVAWDLQSVRTVRTPSGDLRGTLAPLQLGADIEVRTGSFAVFDAACDIDRCNRIWGFARAVIRARATVTADAFELWDARATLTGGEARAGHVYVGFHDTLQVENALARVDLARVSPLASLTTAGSLRAAVRVAGPSNDPVVDVDAAVQDFDLDGHPLGDVRGARLRYRAEVLVVDGIRAHKRSSDYEVPTLRIAFGPRGNLEVDALASAVALDGRDLLSLARLDEQARFAPFAGTLCDATARVRFVRGGPEDPHGKGTLLVRGGARLDAPSAYGERFDEGVIDLDLRWEQALGLAGADVELRALELRDAPSRAGAASVVMSGRLSQGTLSASVTAASLPLSRMAAAARLPALVQGTASGVAHVSGSPEALDVIADVSVPYSRLQGVSFGASAIHVEAGGVLSPQPRVVVRGELLGGQAALSPLIFDGPVAHGSIELRDLDAASLAPASSAHASISGKLAIESVDVRSPASGRAELIEEALSVSLGPEAAGVRLRSRGGRISLADGVVRVPRMDFDVEGPAGRLGTVTVRAALSSLLHTPRIDASADVSSIEAGMLARLVPDLQHARGTLAGSLRLVGPLDDPRWGGELHARMDSAAVRWIPSEMRDIVVDAIVEPHQLRITRADAKLGDGTVHVEGRAPLLGLMPGMANLSLRMRGVHLEVAPGIDVAFEADARALVAVRRLFAGAPHAVLLRGTVGVDSLVYKRPIDLGVDLVGLAAWVGRRHRHAAQEVYDPSRDIVDLALRLRPRQPFRIDDDIAHAAFVPAPALWLRGTNNRPVLVGRVVSVPGGKLRLRGMTLDIAAATLDFDDPRMLAPHVDVVATTEYRRVSQFQPPASGAPSSASNVWHIALRATGPADDLHVALTSDPPVGPDVVALLLTVGLTRTELNAMQAATGSLQAGVGLEALAALGGADRIVRGVLPVDDFRFDSEYSPRSLRMVPDLSLRKRIASRLAATVTTALTEELDVRGSLSLELSRELWLEALWENVALVPATPVGDVGLGMRWRLEFR
jgi:translocation and assembly module TamB